MTYEWTRRNGLSVIELDGREVAQLDKSFWSERAAVRIDGADWAFGKDGRARTATPAGTSQPALVAERPSYFRSTWEVRSPTTVYELGPAGIFTIKLAVLRDGARIGLVGRGSPWTNKPVLDIDGSVPVVDAVFLLWVAFLVRARASAAAAAPG